MLVILRGGFLLPSAYGQAGMIWICLESRTLFSGLPDASSSNQISGDCDAAPVVCEQIIGMVSPELAKLVEGLDFRRSVKSYVLVTIA
jgi:hypothetical protein